MKCRSAGHVVAMVLAVTDIAGLLTLAMGQPQKPETPQAPDHESPQSSPPDTTPYVGPVIPEDRIRTPLPSAPRSETLRCSRGPAITMARFPSARSNLN
jgi:hypothetical protein